MELLLWLSAVVLGIIAVIKAGDAARRLAAVEAEARRLRIDIGRLERMAEGEPRRAPRPEPAPVRRPVPVVAEAPTPERPAPPPPTPKPPPPPPPPRPPFNPRPSTSRPAFDWEGLIGVKLFSWIGGIAFVLAALYFLRYSVEHGWLSAPIRATIGMLFGSGLLAGCELRVARSYKFTANALHGAGIAILYATLFATHALWHLLPPAVVFSGMILVTAVAVGLSIRRDSVFIALLGMMGGFATPALLWTGENRPIALFSYLLLLNVGLTWVAHRKRWLALIAGSLAFTVLYQWTWVAKFLDVGQLPLAIAIFVTFALTGTLSLWLRREDAAQAGFDRVAIFAAIAPLFFALFLAAVPVYGAHLHLLFGFLLLLCGGLGVIAMGRGREWVHAVGAAAMLVTFGIWLGGSYAHSAWPAILGWIAAFVAMYVVFDWRRKSPVVHAAALLLFVFPVLASLEPATASPSALFLSLLALFSLLALYAVRTEQGLVYSIASFFAIATEAVWSARYLTSDRLYAGLAIYAVFGVLFLAIPILARRKGGELQPDGGATATILLSLGLLIFLTFDRVAVSALWGLSILLTILMVGAIAEARKTDRPLVAGIAVVMSWIVLASWWEAASLQQSLIPALFVVAVLGLIVLLASVWAARDSETPEAFSSQTHLAFIGHFFLLFVAGNEALAFPPWPFLAVLALLDLAIGIAALHLRRPSLLIGCAALSQLVLLVWSTQTDARPWPLVALASTIAVAGFTVLLAALAVKREGMGNAAGFLAAPVVVLCLGHVVACTAGIHADAPVTLPLLATHVVLGAAMLALAWRTEWHKLAVLSVPLTAIGTALAHPSGPLEGFLFALVIWALYVGYAFLFGARAKEHLDPHLAAVLGSVPFFVFARRAMIAGGLESVIGILPVVEAMVLLLLLVRMLRMEPAAERQLNRLALVAGAALAFITLAVPLQLEKQWITIAWALEGAALAWLFTRIPHRGLLLWAQALLGVAFIRLAFNPAVLAYHPKSDLPIANWYLYAYLVVAASCFIGAYFFPRPMKKQIAAACAAGTVLLFLLLNIEIADFYSRGAALTFNFFSSSLAQDLTYTIGWAIFAVAMLIAGITLRARPARVAAIVLLAVTVLKCFLHDLDRLGGLYRVGSLLGLAISLVMVGVLLQRFVMTRTAAAEEASRA